MDFGTFLIGTGVAGITLFLWTGLAQNVFPWGVKSVATATDDSLGTAVAAVTGDGMVYTTRGVAAFIAVRPASYYNMGRYFAIEFATQIVVGAILTAILLLTAQLTSETRLILVVLAGLAGVASIDGQYWNWWGFSHRYTLGVAINRLVGYVLASVVLLGFVL